MNIHHGCVGCVSLLHVCLHGLFVISCCAMNVLPDVGY